MSRPISSTVPEHLAGSSDSWHSSITKDGPFTPERNRYHLYIGLFCPFAHRANLVRHLKGLQEILPISIVRAYPKGDANGWPGWQFNPTTPSPDNPDHADATTDHLFGSKYLHEVYFKADPDYKGRYSVPVLWDKHTYTIVNNESPDLLRFLQTCFNDLLSPELASVSLYPEHLRSQIDRISVWMQRDLNTGVYKAGFADTQEKYDKGVIPVFAALNKCEKLLAASRGPYLLGSQLTELDIRLYATAVRFDTMYALILPSPPSSTSYAH
jgi:glutathionyl-hydroquinone reductase